MDTTSTADTPAPSAPQTWGIPMTDQIAAALAAAQLEMKNPGFDTTNPHFKSKFASLAAVRNATIPVLAKHGIAVTQDLRTVEGGVSCTTALWHKSGQRLEFGPLVIPVEKANAWAFGSASSYVKRYSLLAVCAVVGDDDDDGNAVVSTRQTPNTDPRPDGWNKQDTIEVNKYHKRIVAAVEADNDIAALEAWSEASEDPAFATAVWATLPKPIKNKIHDLKQRAA